MICCNTRNGRGKNNTPYTLYYEDTSSIQDTSLKEETIAVFLSVYL